MAKVDQRDALEDGTGMLEGPEVDGGPVVGATSAGTGAGLRVTNTSTISLQETGAGWYLLPFTIGSDASDLESASEDPQEMWQWVAFDVVEASYYSLQQAESPEVGRIELMRCDIGGPGVYQEIPVPAVSVAEGGWLDLEPGRYVARFVRRVDAPGWMSVIFGRSPPRRSQDRDANRDARLSECACTASRPGGSFVRGQPSSQPMRERVVLMLANLGIR